MGSSLSQAVFPTKVAAEAQGRGFAMRAMIARSMMPLAFLSSGFLADRIFEPLMRPGGALAATFIGGLIGAGAGRGIGLVFVLAGTAGFFGERPGLSPPQNSQSGKGHPRRADQQQKGLSCRPRHRRERQDKPNSCKPRNPRSSKTRQGAAAANDATDQDCQYI
jgi:hypothetical protein